VQLVAHRGFARDAPENTLAAVGSAADAGANAVEVDVRAASDGTPVAVHDATVDRVTDRTGPVGEYAPRALAAMDVFGSGEGVPTLDAVLARASNRGLAVNVDVKEPGVAPAVVDAVHDAALPTAAVWASSFHADAIERVADASEAADAPAIDTAYLSRTRRGDPVAVARERGCVAVHPQYRTTIAGDLVERAHAAGLDVYAWTLDSPWVARVVANAGVDGLIADVALEQYAGSR